MATYGTITLPTPLQLKNLADPTDPQDVATKAYADTLKVDPTKIANGTSNVAITTTNGNVTTSVGGNDNILTVTQTGTVVKGSENVSGNLISSGSLLVGLPGSNVFLGNVSNIKVYGGASGQFLKLSTASASTAVSLQIQTTDTTITVVSTANFPIPGYIIIDNEVISYTGVTSTTFTGCTRGQLNSIITGHATSTIVYSYTGGTLEWAPLDATRILNGTSNVAIASVDGPVTVGVAGTPAVATFNSTGVNIAGYANINSGIISTSAPVSIKQTWNNISSTFTGILENIIDTGSLSTSKLIDLQVTSGGTTSSKFSVDKGGNLIVGTGTNGSIIGLFGLGANHITVSGEISGNSNVSTVTGNLGLRAISSIYTDSVALASTTIANAAIHAIGQPTLAASNTGVTFTNASTLYIANVPFAGTNATLGNRYALYIGNGNSYFNGNITTPNQFISTLADGTAPLVVTSKTVVTNLHANLSDYSTVTTTATGATNYLTFANASATSGYQLFSNANLSFNAVNGTLFSTNVNVSSQLISTLADGTAPLVVTSKTVVTNLHANLSDYVTISTATSGSYYPTFVSGTGGQQEYTTTKLSVDAGSGNLTTSGSLISSIATGTVPISVTSTTRVNNLNVAYANVSDYGAVTVSPSTGTFYPVFVNGGTAGNYALQANTNISFDSATGQLNATKLNATDLTLSGNLTVSGTTTTIDTTTTRLVDPIFEMGGGAGGASLIVNDGKDRGLLLHYTTPTGREIGWRVGFNGSTQRITTPVNANFALTGDFTIEAYVNPTTFVTAGVLFSQGAGASAFSIGIHTNGKPFVSFGIVNTALNVSEGSATTLTAPTGTVFTSVLLAHYGAAVGGTMPNFVVGTAAVSGNPILGTETTFIGKNTATIAANGYNAIIGDNVAGTKRYTAVLSFGLFSSIALVAGEWSHIAVSRIGSTVTIYINGVAAGSTTYSSAVGSSAITWNTFGASYQSALVNTLYYNGSISNFRLIKNQGIFIGAFNPGLTVLNNTTVGSTGSVVTSITGTVALLTFQSASIVDNSTTPVAFTLFNNPAVDQTGPVLSSGSFLIADAFIGYKTYTNEFIFANNVTTTNEAVTVTSYGNIRANNYIGNGAALTNISKPADVHYIGTTSIALNRTSANQTLTGVSIDGTAFTANIAGGVAGGVAYQSGPNVTTTSAVGTNGQILQSTGIAIQWTNLDKIANGTSNINIIAGAGNVNTVVSGTLISTVGSSGITIIGNVNANNAIINTGTLSTSSNPAIQLAQTWSNSSANFTGIYSNITDLSSLSTSKLIDLQVTSGGTTSSKFSVDKGGNITATSFNGQFSNGTSFVGIINNSNVYSVVNGLTILNVGSTGATIIGNVFTNVVSISTSTPLTASNPALNVTQTWNSGTTIFTGIYTNITDTASSLSSLLIDLQVGGSSKFRVDKAGNVYSGVLNPSSVNFSTNQGTTPFTVLSNTVVANLNADLVDGYDTSVTTLANTIVVRDTNGNIAGGNITGIITTSLQPSITSVGSLTGLTVSNASGLVNFTTTANVTLGAVANLHITGGSPGQVLSTNGLGGLSWSTVPTATFYIGNTALTTNRTSAAQALTGIISIDGSAAKLTTPRSINGVSFDGSADITVTLPTTGNITSGNITTTGLANIGTTLTVNGMTTLQGIAEVLTTPTVGTYNLNTGTIFYHASVSSNFLAAFANVPGVGTGLSRVVTATIVIAQGSTTAYTPTSVTINGGSAVTVKWYGGLVPTGTTSAVDYFSFSIFVVTGAVTHVTGTYASYATYF
jgi:hypothetical protein